MNRSDAELISRMVAEQVEAQLSQFRAELGTSIAVAIERHAKANPLGLTPEQIDAFSDTAFKAVRGFVTRQVQPLRQRVADVERQVARGGCE